LIDRLKTKPINNFNTTSDRIICHNKGPAAKGALRESQRAKRKQIEYTHKHSMGCHNPLFALTSILINAAKQHSREAGRMLLAKTEH